MEAERARESERGERERETEPVDVPLIFPVFYRAPLGQVCTPRPFFLSSLYSPSYRAPSAQMYTVHSTCSSVSETCCTKAKRMQIPMHTSSTEIAPG